MCSQCRHTHSGEIRYNFRYLKHTAYGAYLVIWITNMHLVSIYGQTSMAKSILSKFVFIFALKFTRNSPFSGEG